MNEKDDMSIENKELNHKNIVSQKHLRHFLDIENLPKINLKYNFLNNVFKRS